MRRRKITKKRTPLIYPYQDIWRVQIGKKNFTFATWIAAAQYATLHHNNSTNENWQLYFHTKGVHYTKLPKVGFVRKIDLDDLIWQMEAGNLQYKSVLVVDSIAQGRVSI